MKKKKLAPYLLVVMMTSLIGGCGQQEYSDVEYMNRALDYYDEHDYASAVIEFKNALRKNPKNAEARWRLGKLYIELGAGADAEKEIKQAIRLGLSASEVGLDLFDSFLLQGEYKEVVTAIQLNKYSSDVNKSRAYAIAGKAFLGEGDLDKAGSLLKRSLAIESNAGAYSSLVDLYLLQRNTALALSFIKEGMIDHEDDLALNIAAADYYRFIRDFEKAIDYYSRALSVRQHIGALLMRADLYLAAGQLDLASKDISGVIKFDKNNPLASFLKAKISYQQQDYSTTKSQLEYVLTVLPGHLAANGLLGIVDYHLGNFQQASRHLEKFQSKVPDNTDVQRVLAEVYIQLGRGENAVSLLSMLAVKSAEDPGLYLMLGDAHLLNNDIHRSKENVAIASSLSSGQPSIISKLAALKILSGESKEAAESLEEIVSGEKINKRAEILLVWALVQSSQLDKALKYASSGVEKEPNDAMRLFIRGLVYQRKNNFDKAKEDFGNALTKDATFFMPAIGLAQIALEEQDYSAARKYFEQVLTIKKDHLGSLMGLVVVEAKTGNENEVVSQLLKAINLRPDAPQPVNALVKIYLAQGGFEKADDIAAQYQNTNPESIDGYVIRANTLQMNSDFVGAERQLRHYLQRRPNDIKRHLLLIGFLRAQGDLSSAIKETEKIISNADAPDLIALKIKLLIELKDYVKAEKNLSKLKFSEEKAVNELFFTLTGDLQVSMGKAEKAVGSYQRAFELSSDIGMLENLTKLDIYLEEFDRARHRINQFLASSPNKHGVRLLSASLYEHRGSMAKAEDEYLELLSYQAENVAALNNLALLYVKQNKFQSALNIAKKAYDILPVPEIADTYGWVLSKSNQPAAALPLLKKAFRLLPGKQEVAYHYAVVLQQLGDFDRSKQVMKNITDKRYLKLLFDEN